MAINSLYPNFKVCAKIITAKSYKEQQSNQSITEIFLEGLFCGCSTPFLIVRELLINQYSKKNGASSICEDKF